MNQFIESLRRLYQNDKLNKDTVLRLFNECKITEEEKLYILSEIDGV